MAKGMFDVECPCCQTVLKVDPETQAVIAHTVPEKPPAIEDLAAEVAKLKGEGARREADGPVIETERLKLRRWRGADVAPNTAMLSDPGTARFITADGKPVTDELVGWRNAAIMAGHWVLHGIGMFVVEEKASGKFVGRVGPWFPPGWPGFEVGWGARVVAPGLQALHLEA